MRRSNKLAPALAVLLGLLLGVLSQAHSSGLAFAAGSGTWSPAGSLAFGRALPTATLLANGKVLVTGGFSGEPLGTAELYDPVANTWSTAGSLATARYNHTATLLVDGKVLVVGGYGSFALASAELYDPVANTWLATASLATARYYHTATSLQNGKVLVAGGYGGSANALASAELYDPVANTWSAGGSLTTARYHHRTTLLANGEVLVAGGYNGVPLANAELYNPVVNTWSTAGSLTTARYAPTATLLANDKVLVAGGSGNGTAVLASAELYDPVANTWSAAASLTIARGSPTATLLTDGKVLVAGGSDNVVPLASAELYDPVANTWLATASLATARYYHTATSLQNGKVLVAGGYGGSANALASAELYTPSLPNFRLPYESGSGILWSGGPHAFDKGGLLTATFAYGQGSGLDFAAPGNTSFDVLSIADGTVAGVQTTNCDAAFGFGCWVAVRHSVGDSVAVYAHLQPGSILVTAGDPVSTGRVLGRSGQSGQQSIVHLHLELRKGNPTGTSCTTQTNCFGDPLGWGDLAPYIDGWHIWTYADSAGNEFNYDGSATKGAVKTVPNFPYSDNGHRQVVKATVDSSFICDTAAPSCEPSPQSSASLTQFAGGGDLGAGGGSGAPGSAPALAGVVQSSGQLTSTNIPLAPASVGGVAEQPELSSLQSRAAPSSVDHRTPYVLVGAIALLAVATAGGWVARRSRKVS